MSAAQFVQKRPLKSFESFQGEAYAAVACLITNRVIIQTPVKRQKR
jgi:hypothetical protein